MVVLTPVYSSIAYWISLVEGDKDEAIDAYTQHILNLEENNNFKLKM